MFFQTFSFLIQYDTLAPDHLLTVQKFVKPLCDLSRAISKFPANC